MEQHPCVIKRSMTPMLLAVLAMGRLLVGAEQASAGTVQGDVCMQRTYGGPTVTNANRLNCTANDIAIARAVSASPDSCILGQFFDLTATFEVNINASERYDAGFYFRTDGGADARGPQGMCSLSTLDLPPAMDEPWVNLEGDFCGDFASAGTVEVTINIGQVLCTDTDADGFLNLPNCTAWHNNRGTGCGTETDAIPETKSKCKCDDEFQVPVTVESPSGAVVKKAISALVTYQVEVKNNSGGTTVTIEALEDDVYGDITSVQGGVIATDCGTLVGDMLAPGATSDACTFTVDYAHPGSGGDVQNTVTATIKSTTAPFEEVDVMGSTAINVDLNVVP
jgi:hypothetical protein